ncbi:hypothetical protein [Flavobacterium franklandianum]|uniref:DUF2231 domain-containing protein n=1 Tax=Flavobacterium franklandianum TaxID=2594430 RepID=A0A553C7P0_9FLAO|nr:hypothetical protein [Flavobacterium franklandianum]TRX16473.1 hypothetical protein FNW17_12935 [Flavobacterium franklandianum]
MNDAHLHLVVNHFPIIGTILGLGILITGIILKNNSVKSTAYVLFIVAAIFAVFSMGTGEGAEELVEDMPSVGKQIIHEHEEMAEKLAIILYVLGAISLAGLYLNYKKHAKAQLVSFIVLVVAIGATFLAQQTGTTGGEIRHTEIRANATPVTGPEQNTAAGEQSESEVND